MRYALIVNSSRRDFGARHVVVEEPDGWVEATSRAYRRGDEFPRGLKLFDSTDDAEAFARRWKGHPWWCVPNGKFEIVPVEPITEVVVTGWRRAATPNTETP